MNDAELLQLRMRALRLTHGAELAGDGQQPATGADRIVATARHMLAVQGQDWRSSRWALGVRAPGTTVDDVSAAFASGAIVRSWPMRSTVHVVAAEDIGWMQQATNRRVLAGAPKRREYLGISESVLSRLVEVSEQVLAGGSGHDRDSLSQAWTDAGIEWHGSWRYHVIWWLCQNGIAVFGPPGPNGEPRLVLAREWIREPRQLRGDDALAELARRYAASRGPVQAQDLAWWTGLGVRDARRSLLLATEAGWLAPLRAEGTKGTADFWVDPEVLGAAQDETPSEQYLLLPAFDEHLLGYADRGAQLDPEDFTRVMPVRNGIFLATVVRDGRVVGTWKRSALKNPAIAVTPFAGDGDAGGIELASLRAPAAEWAAFHGVEVPPLISAS